MSDHPILEKMARDTGSDGVAEIKAIAAARHSHYDSWSAFKPNGRGERKIDAPDKQLKRLQRWLLRHIVYRHACHEACHGFRRKRSCATNAKAHLDNGVGPQSENRLHGTHVLGMDITDFFPSIKLARVLEIFEQLGRIPESDLFPPEVAQLFAELATLNGALPQGAPTSPALANLAASNMDCRLNGLANFYRCRYSRYADDLTFSGARHPLSHLRKIVPFIVEREGFRLNKEKTRLLGRHRRQSITGIVVNSGTPNPPRSRYRKLRAIVHNFRKDPLGAARRAAEHHYPFDADGLSDEQLIARFKRQLRGHLAYISSINPEKARKLNAYSLL